jgi:O-antigen/teichoic acid export membrane protein
VPSAFKRLVVHIAHYSLASLLTTVAGLISFPIFTRVFSVADYGVMNLISATLSIGVLIGKLGVQHSIVRFRSDIVAGQQPFALGPFYSTVFIGMAMTGILTAVVMLLATQVAPPGWFGSTPRLRDLFAIACALIFVQVMESAVFNIARAEQVTSLLMKYQVAKKYCVLGLILLALFHVERTLGAFYTAMVIGESLAAVTLVFLLFRGQQRPRPRARQFSPPLYRQMLSYGIPMMVGYELSGVILSVGDRYVIEGMIGEAPLGLYSAAYNMCQYVQMVLIASVGTAIMPMYMQMWVQKGRDETAAFISRSLRTYALLAMPVVGGLAAVGPELLPSLASEKFLSATAVVPWVIAGMAMDGLGAMVGAGLFIQRRTRTIMVIVMTGAVLNIALNVVLIPPLGIVGSALATLLSYALTSIWMAIASRSILPIELPWGTALRAGIASLVMFAAVFQLLPGKRLLTVGVRAAVGAAVFAAVILLIDRDARAMLAAARRRLRRGG